MVQMTRLTIHTNGGSVYLTINEAKRLHKMLGKVFTNPNDFRSNPEDHWGTIERSDQADYQETVDPVTEEKDNHG